MPQTAQFTYEPASPEETAVRSLLMGAILEFGAPHAFESGAITSPLDSAAAKSVSPSSSQPALDYRMLQEEGTGYSIFAALRTVYEPETPVEPVRFAVEFFTTSGVAVIDVAIPSRQEPNNRSRERVYDEKKRSAPSCQPRN